MPDFRAELAEAAQTGDLERLRAMLDRNPSLASMPDEQGYTPLHYAAYFGHTELARYLVQLGAEVDAVSMDPLRNTPLHAAASSGHLEVGRVLLDAGSSLAATQTGGWTALHCAADRGHADLVELLLSRGAEAGARSASGRTAADLAAERGHETLASRLRH